MERKRFHLIHRKAVPLFLAGDGSPSVATRRLPNGEHLKGKANQKSAVIRRDDSAVVPPKFSVS